jgi:hypothetical protein
MVEVNYSINTRLKVWDVAAVADSCSGGGKVKYQAEIRCGSQYVYGEWVTSGISGPECTNNSSVSDGYLRINENNPIRFTCWVPGDTDTGTCRGNT